MSEKEVDLSNDSFILDLRGTMNGAENKNSKKRKHRPSSSSESDDSSSSSDTQSSDSAQRSRRHRRKKRRHDTRSRKYDKLDKLIAEVSDLKSKFSRDSREPCDASHDLNFDECIDNDVSENLYSEDHSDLGEKEPQFSLSIGTRLKDPDVLKTPSSYLEVLKGIQRLDDVEWQNVRYADVQKNYRHTPGFTELEPNEEIKRYDTSRTTANADKAFAAISYALIKQKDHLEKELRDFLSWAKATPDLKYDTVHKKVEGIFVTGDFSKISNDALQLVCGHRAEVIQHRREAILASVKDPLHKSILRKIPPSCNNLFDADKFTSALEKMGDSRKVFWPRTKDRIPATQTGPNTAQTASASSSFQYQSQTAHSARGNNTRSRGATTSNRPFRGRGGSSRGRRNNDRPATYRNTQYRHRSPSSHRDRRSNRKY